MPHDWKMISDRHGLRTWFCPLCKHYLKDQPSGVIPTPDSSSKIIDGMLGIYLYLNCDEMIVRNIHGL